MTSREPEKPVGDILLVDDTPDNLRLLSELLTQQGHKVRKVTDGMWALQAAILSPPDLILLDIVMPEMNGYQVCSFLKASDRTRDIPIIFLSVNDEALDKVMAFRFGGADYITKPFESAEVLVRVETQLKLSQMQRQIQAQNQQLQQEMHDRRTAEAALAALNQTLEATVQTRTVELIDRTHQLLALQTQLQTALAQAQHLNTLKSELMSTISHEFYAPLSVIKLSAELLAGSSSESGSSKDLPENRHFQRITESVNRLQQMLENTLFLAQAESQTLPFNPQPMRLIECCRAIVNDWNLPIDSPHRLVFRSQRERSLPIYADVGLLKQMVTQLIANAVRYSPDGGTVQVELLDQPNKLLICVQDEGIGIPVDDRQKVFDRFYRASNASSIPGNPGAGLGLAVVKWVADLHGAVVTISAPIDRGTLITVSLPIHKTAALLKG
jgi:two-component system sensor histidine kinase/response regulator